MKNIILAVLVSALTWIGFSRKKKDSTTTNGNGTTTTAGTTTGNTTGGSPTGGNNSSSTTFSVNSVDQGSFTPISGPSTSNNDYEFFLFGAGWPLTVAFSGTNAPVSGTYTIEDSTAVSLPARKCYMAGINTGVLATAHSGIVTVSTGTPNTVSFSNIPARQLDQNGNIAATYTLAGSIKY